MDYYVFWREKQHILLIASNINWLRDCALDLHEFEYSLAEVEPIPAASSTPTYLLVISRLKICGTLISTKLAITFQ